MANNLEKYRVHILCEDKTHYHFVRGFLLSQAIKDSRRFSVDNLPEGLQSGEQFVRQRFVEKYKAYARSQENKLLVVIQDIDKSERTPENAENEFNVLLQNEGLRSIGMDDKLLLVFPKKNIETWLEWLTTNNETIDENSNYKNHKYTQKHMKPSIAGKEAGAQYTKSLSDDSVCNGAPSSLIIACNNFAVLCNTL